MFLLLAPAGLAAQSGDSATLQSILQELRQMRQDMLGMTVVAQRVQILLYRIQLQDDAAKKAEQHHTQTRLKLMGAQRARTDAENELRESEGKLSSLQNPAERTAIERVVSEMKKRADIWSRDESDSRAAEAEAAGAVKVEQLKLAELQERLDRLEHQLEAYSRTAPAK
jgi:hypothetical protein